MKILVLSCDKNKDLFDPFHHCMEKYWPEHPEIIYCTETVENPYYKTIFKNYPLNQWTTRLRECLHDINDDYILLAVDDLFIRDYVDNEKIINLVNYFDNNTAALNLERSWDARDIKLDENILIRCAQGSYKTSVMCSIYSKEKLLNILNSVDTDPWTFEINNRHLNYRYLITKSCQYIDWGWKERKWFGVKRGKWCRESVDFLKKEGLDIDFTERGIFGECNRAVICCIAKNENSYINNWVNYHLNIGFDHIYIYDNNDGDTPDVLTFIDQKDKVTIFRKNNIHKQAFQLQCYNEFYSCFLDTFDWCAFIDVDEFISGVSNVKEWLGKLNDFESVRLKWKLFGDDEVIERDTSVPVQNFFKKVLKNNISENGKCIVKGGLKDAYIGSCHYAFRGTKNYIEGLGGERTRIKLLKQCLPSGKPCNSRITIVEDYSRETIFLNHYMTKTLAEFIDQKFGRGDAIFEARNINFDYYWRINKQTSEKLAYIDKRMKLKLKKKEDDPVDIVVPYVDSSDPEWKKLFLQYNTDTETKEETNAANRFRGQGDFFKYVFRGIAKNLPFIRKVHLLVQSESQVPSWIDRSKVNIVLHKDFIPEQFLPTFNSCTIEMFLWNIKGLAEKFIYSNDDIYFCNPMTKGQFYDDEGRVKNNTRLLTVTEGVAMYTKQCANSYAIVYGLDPKKIQSAHAVNHIARPYLRSAVKECFDKYKDKIYESISKFREEKNFNVYLYDNYIVSIDKQVPRTNVLFTQINQNHMSGSVIKTTLKDMKPHILCVNDINPNIDIYSNPDLKWYFLLNFKEKCKYEK